MVAHRRLLRTGLVDQVTGAELLGGEQLDNTEAERVGEEPEESSTLAGDVDGRCGHDPIRSHQQCFISGYVDVYSTPGDERPARRRLGGVA